jgi:hypothetical protein
LEYYSINLWLFSSIDLQFVHPLSSSGLLFTETSVTTALDLTNPLPPLASLGRWSAEPIKHIFLPCTTFIPNAKGYPVLSKSLQAFFKGIFKVSLDTFRRFPDLVFLFTTLFYISSIPLSSCQELLDPIIPLEDR